MQLMPRTRMVKLGVFEGYVWQSKSGEYCWEVRDDECALAGGGGYDEVIECELDMRDEFEEFSGRYHP